MPLTFPSPLSGALTFPSLMSGRARLIAAGLVLGTSLLATPVAQADVTLKVLLGDIAVQPHERDVLKRQHAAYLEQRHRAEARHDQRALAKARADYLAEVEHIIGHDRGQRFGHHLTQHASANEHHSRQRGRH